MTFLLTTLAVAAAAQTFSFDFNVGQEGWEGGSSDYSNESDFQFKFARVPLPKPLDTTEFGGSPGRSVYLKAGATAVKLVDEGGRMNFDKGNQRLPGPDMDTLGEEAVFTKQGGTGMKKNGAGTCQEGSHWYPKPVTVRTHLL